jgi:hypothetical protein
VDNELEGMWKEAIKAQFNLLSQHLLQGTLESHEENPVRITSLWAKI